jgi:signal peptidase II
MKTTPKTHLFCFLLSLFAITFDQATKWSILAFMPQERVIKLTSFLNLVLVFNKGTSFGLLSPSNLTEFYFIIILIILCIIFLIYMFFKLKSISEQILCSILIGGAIGNLLDRFFHGAVVDFIDVYYGNWHWPAFNFADSCISCSAFLLVILNLFSSKN